ncbi:MAG: hypothetical protein RLY30_1176 [Pseudomonadota bacterium]|jgi:hypothetical protein
MQLMSTLRAEVASLAAQWIADDGLDYQTAKLKALQRITGARGGRGREDLPTNEEVEAAVREHLQLYYPDDQPKRLRALRASAARLMALLDDFSPWLMGAAANGTATEHSGIHLECVADSAKELGILLLNQGLASEASCIEGPGGAREALELLWEGEPTCIGIVQRAQGLRARGGLSLSDLQPLLEPDRP